MTSIPTETKGICLYCNQTISKSLFTKHFQKHLNEKIKTNKPGSSFLLKVETEKAWGPTPYFLFLWIDGEAKLNVLDDFLRNIWLECCGHMSSFTIAGYKKSKNRMWNFFEANELLQKGKTKEHEKLMESSSGELPKSAKVNTKFYKNLKLDYLYDFGSTTALLITVLAEYPIIADEKIILLTRNTIPEIKCGVCNKLNATKICTAHEYDENNLFCESCAKKYEKECDDFADYASLPLVNSPRAGVCSYAGGIIDTKRDTNTI
jgi:hypothetical protein